MKLRNKKTGEVREWQRVGAIDYGEMNEVYEAAEYNSLAELNDEWEDYQESNEDVEEFNEMYKDGYLQGYWDARCKIPEIAKEVFTKTANELYDRVRKELCGEEDYSSARDLAENICEVMDKERKKNEQHYRG